MKFEVIDRHGWEREEYFEHYFSSVPCTYSMTVKLDITKVKMSNQELYPTMLYLLARVVNKHEEFRMAVGGNGKLGVFDKLNPSYTVFHKKTETFSNIWTEYSEDYEVFCEAYRMDMEEFGSVYRMDAKPETPSNTFSVSMIPWESFEGFNLNLQKGYDYLLPIFTMGRYIEEDGHYRMPLAVQVHHAVCDGFHLCRFIDELKILLA